MTVQECYEMIGADWQDVLQRFGGSQAIVKKFAIKFLDDPSFSDMKKAVAEKNVEDAFRAAHTLKGVCLNLGFSDLYHTSYDITEIFRAGTFEGAEELMEAMDDQYQTIQDAVTRLMQEGTQNNGFLTVWGERA